MASKIQNALVLTFVAAIALMISFSSCGRKGSGEGEQPEEKPLPDTLRVATLYSPTSYFTYRDEEMGYDYSLIKEFVSDKGLELKLEVAPSLSAMIEMLDSGKVDLIAYEIPVTAEFKQKVLACGPQSETHQVLVQPKRDGVALITDVTDLVGKDVYVEGESKYQYRLENLNDELGGGIDIHIIDRDTLITEDLIGMVSDGTIPLTIVDSDIARLNATYFRDLDISLPLSFPQKSSWGVAPGNSWLADSIDNWFSQDSPRQRQAALLKRYFELSKNDSRPFAFDFSKGKLSPYDEIFKRHAENIGWDWRILAAQGYTESRFDPTQVSWAGARGVMQIMPRTARAYGLSMNRIAQPEANIETASKILKDLDKSFSSRVKDPEERKKFVLAAYNGGIAHVLDAIALAKKYGKNPEVWDNNVESTLLMKANREYYSDPVCRAGYFRGRETVAYVKHVMSYYNRAKRAVS